MDKFLENLTKLLEQKGISRTKLAKELGTTEATIRSWYKGSKPNIELVIKIANYFSQSLDDMFGITSTELSEEEKQIIAAYRELEPGKKAAIKTLLDIESESTKLSTLRIG